ncbi:MAG TPA: phosphomethylpyrimidine synthase ThiC [bacterium]|nr:phosphomethylpyrimidine synthase ThiC [bacterium]
MTILDKAKQGKITADIRKVAKKEGVDPEFVRAEMEAGRIAIPKNKSRKALDVEGIGNGLKTKVNANIGTSKDMNSLSLEKQKLAQALDAGTDAVMDLSTGGNIRKILKSILADCPKPLGTVPLYETFVNASGRCAGKISLDVEELFDVIEGQADAGVDFMTVHCGLNRSAVERLDRTKRVTGIVSRGGAFVAAWMRSTGNENPLYEHFDRLLKICRKYDVTISLGDGLRPGCLADASDRPMIQEMIMLGELAQKALDNGVQAIIEGPGHMPMDQIVPNVKIQKSLCQGAPYYVLGPLVTDVAPGYDHITSAIGGAIAASAGADFLCYVTPTEHLGLPGPKDVRDGVMASKIAAHAADVVKLNAGGWDRKMSEARKILDWEAQEKLGIDPEKFDIVKDNLKKKKNKSDRTCSMCGEFCAIEVSDELGKGPV